MQKPNKSQIIFLSVGLIVGLTSGLLIPGSNSTDHQNDIKETRGNDPSYKYINPLLECNNGSHISRDKNLNSLKKEVEEVIGKEIESNDITFASVYYRDLNNGPWFGINEKEYFSPASLIKVPLMIAYFKQAELDSTILDKKIIDKEPYNPEEQNIKPEITIEPGKEYTVMELIERMIIYSDNGAYQALLHNIDNQLVFQIYNDLGVDISKAKEDPSGNIITVKDYSSFFRILFNSSYLSKAYSEKALNVLSRSKFTDGLVKSLPRDVSVAHKFGERQYASTGEKQLHDCGIIYSSNRPYLLCVMTRGSNFTKTAKTIDKISSTIYKGLQKSN